MADFRYDSAAALIRYLRQSANLNLVINDFIGWMRQDATLEHALYPCSIHDNPYCMAVKSDKTRWDRCIRSKRALQRSLERSPGPLVGHCPFGVMERAYPVLARGRVVGAVSVTALKGDPERAQARLRRAERGSADAAALWAVYQRELHDYDTAMAEAECAAGALALTLSALSEHSRLPGAAQSAPQRQHELVDRAMEYLYSQAAGSVRAADVAAFCHVSESYLQHLFAHQRGQSMVKTLAAIRLERARAMLREGDLPVHQVAELCGFDDPNYFSTVFSARYGESPRAYRTRHR